MSIVDEITRLTSAKANIKAAIEAKGVSVPSSAHLDAFPSYVSAISGGGGLSAEALTVTSNGVYTASSGYAYTPVTVSVAGGGGGDIDAMVARTISSYNGSAPVIGSGAFERCSMLTTVNAPNATVVSSSAFRNCALLSYVSLPNVSLVDYDAFGYCSSLTTVYMPLAEFLSERAFQSFASTGNFVASFPKVKTIGGSCFYNNYALKSVSFPECTTISAYAFYTCSKLTAASFPEVTTMGSNVFATCSSLYAAYFPKMGYIPSNTFSNGMRLSVIDFPLASWIGSTAIARQTYNLISVSFSLVKSVYTSAFYSCAALRTARFDSLDNLSSTAFASCTHLVSLYMLGSSLVSLKNVNAFVTTPISTYTTYGTGSIYVRESLYSSYLTATNWVNYSSRFVSLTDAEIAALP